jgi:hypothetical protein
LCLVLLSLMVICWESGDEQDLSQTVPFLIESN